MKSIGATTEKRDPAAVLRINLTYLWRHGRMPNLSTPTRFTELVQSRKLDDRDLRMPAMSDKLAVKAEVAERLGRDWVTPTLWSGERLPECSRWRSPLVVKSRHGCNQNVFVRDNVLDWALARRRSRRWMKRAYGGWLDEWLYAHVQRGIVVEPFVGGGPGLPIDYKIYVFAGRASHVQVHLDRASRHRWIVHDIDWRPMSDSAPRVARPSALSAMTAAAEELGRGFSFARVDFYQPGGQPLFGEFSFYPGSGLDRFDPTWLDGHLGRLWLNAGGVHRHRLTARDAGEVLAA